MAESKVEYFEVLSDYRFAGRVQNGRSDKDWVACLARKRIGPVGIPQDELLTEEAVLFLCVHGRHGSNLIVEPPFPFNSLRAGGAHYRKRVLEKQQKKHYVSVEFAPYLQSFGRPLGLALVDPLAKGTPSLSTGGATELGERLLPAQTESVSHEDTGMHEKAPSAISVEPVSQERMRRLLLQGEYLLTEKVDGERCLLCYDGEVLIAYNRQGNRMSMPPEHASVLRELNAPFVLDGERMTGSLAGQYVVFDLLEWDGEDMREMPYHQRMGRLRQVLAHRHLLREDRPTPTLLDGWGNSMLPGCVFLEGVGDIAQTQRLLQQLQVEGAEGVILRRRGAPYQESPLKFKFLADLDVIVYGIQIGTATGSLKLALIRPSDGKLLDIGRVRSGLTNQDISNIQEALARKEPLVYTISFLPKRTIGLSLVEPRTSRERRRKDKLPVECTTDQFREHFGVEKDALIARAMPIASEELVQVSLGRTTCVS